MRIFYYGGYRSGDSFNDFLSINSFKYGLDVDVRLTSIEREFLGLINERWDMTIMHTGQIGGSGAWKIVEYCRRKGLGGILVAESSLFLNDPRINLDEIHNVFDGLFKQGDEEGFMRILREKLLLGA